MSDQPSADDNATILLVEDSPSDARLTIEALKEGRLLNKVRHVTNGDDALAFLRQQAEFADAPRPDLILLDLNIPRGSGHDVLAEIKRDEDLRQIPVVVLTTSKDQEDIDRSYGLGANCYITKPVELEQFVEVVRSIDRFFFKVATLPPR